MYFYKVMYETESGIHEYSTAFSTNLPTTTEEIISVVEANGGLSGTLAREHFKDIKAKRIWIERISKIRYFIDAFINRYLI